MMKLTLTRFLIPAFVSVGLSGCGLMSGYFPDKAQDYQFSAELPPLKVPPEIANKGLEKRKPNKKLTDEAEAVGVIGDVVNAAPNSAASAPAANPAPEAQKEQPIRVELVKFGNGEQRLQINKSVAMAWRLIGKSLTANGIEITSRDQANAEFIVQYDPNGSDFKDDSFWDELNFVFGDDHNQEKPYHLKVLPNQLTEIVILDEHGKPSADAGALSLLKLLSTTLIAEAVDE